MGAASAYAMYPLMNLEDALMQWNSQAALPYNIPQHPVLQFLHADSELQLIDETIAENDKDHDHKLSWKEYQHMVKTKNHTRMTKQQFKIIQGNFNKIAGADKLLSDTEMETKKAILMII